MVIRNGSTIPVPETYRHRVQVLGNSLTLILPTLFSGLALVSSAIFDAGGVTYFMFPVALSATAMAILVLNARSLRLDLGAKWAWIPLALIWLSAFAHLCWHGDYQGLCFCTWICALYLLGRQIGVKTWKFVIWGAVAASLFIIVTRLSIFLAHTYPIGDYDSYNYFHNTFWKPHHLVTLLIVAGLILSKDWMVWGLGITAIALSGSEEGMIALVIVIAVVLLKMWLAGRRNQVLGLLGVCAAIALILLFSGYSSAAFPNLTLSRFTSLESVSHLRTKPILDLLRSGDWILGTGFTWTVMWDTPHMVILKIASQFGIIAGLSWLFMMAAGFFRTKYKVLILVLLWFSVVDHSLWTELAIWSPMVIGIASKEVTHAKSH